MILLTFDSDFSDIGAYPPENYAGIIAFQVHNHPEVIPEIFNSTTTCCPNGAKNNLVHGR